MRRILGPNKEAGTGEWRELHIGGFINLLFATS
jgi:hypothetical protein